MQKKTIGLITMHGVINYGSALQAYATVKTINEEQNKTEKVGYTTTLKMMQLMAEKKILTRETKGRGHIYKSNIPEDEIEMFLYNKYTHTTFGKSAMKLVLRALENHTSSDSELQEIKDYLKNLKD